MCRSNCVTPRPDTTLENYVKEIPDSVYQMVDAMYEGIAGEIRRPSPSFLLEE